MTTTLTIPTASMAGMGFSLIVSWILPFFLLFFARKKLKAKILPFFIGGGSFFLFAMILEQFSHMLFLEKWQTVSRALNENLWLYALYGGLAAGIFEETGRYLSMKFLMKKSLNKENAFMYGAGHGGIEAILIVGFASISNLTIAFMANQGQLAALITEGVNEQAAAGAVQLLASLPSWQFYFAGLERIMAMVLQIALSILIYGAVSEKSRRYLFPLAIALHAGVDFAAVILSRQGSLIGAELLILAGTVMVSIIAWRVWQNTEFAKANLYLPD